MSILMLSILHKCQFLHGNPHALAFQLPCQKAESTAVTCRLVSSLEEMCQQRFCPTFRLSFLLKARRPSSSRYQIYNLLHFLAGQHHCLQTSWAYSHCVMCL